MKKITPVGDNLLVLPLPKENYTTESGITVMDKDFAKAKVMEVSQELSHIYKKGDIIVYAAEAGISQYYKQQQCLWLNGKGHPQGHVVAIVTEEK